MHATQDCKSIIVKCCQYKGIHEAWYHKCSIRMREWKKLSELKYQLPFKLVERSRTYPKVEPEKESSSNLDDSKVSSSTCSSFSNKNLSFSSFDNTTSSFPAFGTEVSFFHTHSQ